MDNLNDGDKWSDIDADRRANELRIARGDHVKHGGVGVVIAGLLLVMAGISIVAWVL